MTHANLQPPLGPRLQQLWATRRRLVLLVGASVVAVIVVAVVLASGGSHDKYWTTGYSFGKAAGVNYAHGVEPESTQGTPAQFCARVVAFLGTTDQRVSLSLGEDVPPAQVAQVDAGDMAGCLAVAK
jgi:hypothetical protein